MATLQMLWYIKREQWLNDPLRINPIDALFFPVGIPLVVTETLVVHFREDGDKTKFFVAAASIWFKNWGSWVRG